MGHAKAAKILSTIISNVQYNEMVRSLAVYSLQRVAKLEPARVKPILMTIIENIAERPEVCPWFLIKKLFRICRIDEFSNIHATK